MPDSCDCSTGAPNPDQGRVYNCEECGALGWCSENGGSSLSKIPALDDRGMLCDAIGITSPFFEEIRKRPKRTRLDAITPWLERERRGLEDKLDDIQKLLFEYGLKARRILNDDKVKKDESIIVCVRGWEARKIELDECPHAHPERSSGEQFWVHQENLDLFDKLGEVLTGGFRDQQRSAIRSSLETPGSLLIAALPTGFGKTRIGQVITWLNRKTKGGPTLLISPLIALMDDQREQFRIFNDVLAKEGLSTLNTYFLTGAEETGYEEIMQKLKNNEVDVLCCSPETLLNPVSRSHWVEVFLQMGSPFGAMVVDEAHMVGEWGASIRPEFQLLGWVKDRLLERNGSLRVLLMSATITKEEEKELKKLFKRGLKTLDVVREDRIREDLSFNVVVEGAHETVTAGEWVEFLARERSRIPARWYNEQADKEGVLGRPPLLLYTPTKKAANGIIKNEVTERLCEGKSKLVKVYDGDTSNKDTLRIGFVNDRFRALVATSAFGMGIDKGDVWTIAYLGMPYSLKGLYQGFGRAARKSNWPLIEEYGLDVARSKLKSGNCLAVIPDTPPRSFKSQLGRMKTMERIWDMFYLSPEAHITSNGYAIVPVIYPGERRAFWDPTKLAVGEEEEGEEEEGEDTADSWSLEQELDERSRNERSERLKLMGLLKRRRALFQYNMWTIACLQRTEKVEFMGLHPAIISRNKNAMTGENEDISLSSIIEEEGYEGLLRSLPKGDGRGYVPKGQERFAVLRFRRSLIGMEELKEMTMEGHKYLHDRHTRGREELKKFLSQVSGKGTDKICVRKALAPAIGMESRDVKPCVDTDPGRFRMPCNVCREKMGFKSLGESGFLWSKSETISKVLGEKIAKPKLSLGGAKKKEMRNMVLKEEIEGLIERDFEEDMIPSRLSIGELKRVGKEYKLWSMTGKKLTNWYARDSVNFSPPLEMKWPRDSAAIIIWRREARIVGSSVYEKESEEE